jgi:hypothetical protein
MYRVVFFGASVTAQNKNHSSQSVTGYVTFLDDILSGSRYLVDRVAYGSSQYSNMGHYGLTNAILTKPNAIFFEWHTTGESYINPEMLIRQHRLLSLLDIKMILLILPSLRHQNNDSLQKYGMLTTLGLPFLDLRFLTDSEGRQDFLRDEVHTNEVGAELYGRIIDKYISDELLSPSAGGPDFQLCDLLQHSNDEYGALLYREVPLDLCLKAGDSLHISLDRSASVIFTFIRGPRCPDLEVGDSSSDDGITVHLIDQWSYYDRESCGLELSLKSDLEYYLLAQMKLPDASSFCPKLLESAHSSKMATSLESLTFELRSVYIPVDSFLSLRKGRRLS